MYEHTEGQLSKSLFFFNYYIPFNHITDEHVSIILWQPNQPLLHSKNFCMRVIVKLRLFN